MTTTSPEPGLTAQFAVRHVTRVSDDLVASMHALVHEMMREQAAIGWIDPPDVDEVEAWLLEIAAKIGDGDACLLVAEERSGDRVVDDAAGNSAALVGFAYWARLPGKTERVNANIEKVAVSSRTRGHGIGRRLVESLLDHARAAGIEQITLDCRGNNHAALALYAKLGFVEYGRIADFVAIGDERFDNVYLTCDLRDGSEDITCHGDAPRGPGASALRRQPAEAVS